MDEWIYFNQFSGEDLSFYPAVRFIMAWIIRSMVDAGIIDE